jgi:hypothetical protein
VKAAMRNVDNGRARQIASRERSSGGRIERRFLSSE